MTNRGKRPNQVASKFAACIIVLAFTIVPVSAAEVDPEADKILRNMSNYMAGLKSFSFTGDASTEVLMRTGQKLQITATGHALFDRKRGFKVSRKSGFADLTLFYDGKIITLYVADLNSYTSREVDGGNDAALDFVRTDFQIEASGADLLYSNPYEGLLYDIESGQYLGETWLRGVPVHHLAYRAADIDWQIWIRADGEPVPMKYVITSKWMTSAPQFTLLLYDWNTSAIVDDSDLKFSPPEGAVNLATVPVDEITGLGRE